MRKRGRKDFFPQRREGAKFEVTGVQIVQNVFRSDNDFERFEQSEAVERLEPERSDKNFLNLCALAPLRPGSGHALREP